MVTKLAYKSVALLSQIRITMNCVAKLLKKIEVSEKKEMNKQGVR